MKIMSIKKDIDVMKRYFITKRAMDIVGSLIGLVLFSPIFLVVALLIKVEDPKGPIIFAHKRVGKNGELIPVYKFRSMYQNADEMIKSFTPEQKKEYAETFKLKDDPRITKIGRFIRKTSLDEIPQFLNVLKGEMSIVGPRPVVEAELEKYGDKVDLYLMVTPGLTGMWQAHGRSDTSYEERVALDTYYVENRSILLDIKIILATFISVIKGKGSY